MHSISSFPLLFTSVALLKVLETSSARFPAIQNLSARLGDEVEEDANNKVLLIDLRGPNRMAGDGVRVMGMLVDLKKCPEHKEVHVLSDNGEYTRLKEAWDERVRNKVFPGVEFWSPWQYKAGDLKLSNYKRIIIGAKLDLMANSGVVNQVIDDLLKHPAELRDRVSVFWDDVPFVRCQYKTDSNDFCPKVPALVRNVIDIAHNLFVLTPEDQDEFKNQIKKHGMPDINIRVWPMRIENMARLLPGERYDSVSLGAKKYILMMGNHHPVNTKNLKLLFSGSVARICNQIKKRKSNVKLLFLGAMSVEVKKLVEARRFKYNMKCVQVETGFTPQAKLERDILPATRAFLNPFLFNVSSGISVKTYEAIMQGFPLITSSFGMHGLRGIHNCKSIELPKDPESTSDLTDFIINNVVDPDGYRKFSHNFQTVSKRCQEGQMARYPVHPICS